MPKLRGPLLSLGATGGLTKLLSLARRMGRNIIERKPIPVDAKSPAQLFNRHMFTKCTALWHLLSEAEKQEWESLARPRHMTGYAWFISQCLRPNPGIYLPLQGGTMSGDIDMATSRILNLLDPVLAQEAATKAYADTHGMQAHEDTHIKDGSDEIDSALGIAAMAGLANTKIWQGNAAGRPIEVAPPAGAPTASGSYVGDGTKNRAIPHGLGVTPKIVFVSDGLADTYSGYLIGGQQVAFRGVGGNVTDPTATNFYVSVIDPGNNSFNLAARTYYWAAFG